MGLVTARVNPDRKLQAYVIGVAIGDGNLSNPNGRAVRLRVTCDAKYPGLILRIADALRQLLPLNRVAEQVRAMMEDLNFRPRLYCVPNGVRRKYQVRLSRHVLEFLDVVRPDKS